MMLIDSLKQSPIFEEFSDSELDALERAMTISEYPEGHIFVREGDGRVSHNEDAMYVIVEGEVSMTISRGGDHFGIIGTMPVGTVFGILALIAPDVRAATCSASGPVRAASLNKSAFDYLFESNAPLAFKFQFALARQLARDLRKANHELYRALLDVGAAG